MPSFHSFTVLSAFVYERKSCPRYNQTDTHVLKAVQTLCLTYLEDKRGECRDFTCFQES